jgi:hypothetical protein
MAVLDRRTWEELKAEHIARMGRVSDTNYALPAGRAERFLETAYEEICHTWHHYELDGTDSDKAFVKTVNSLDISSLTAYIVVAVARLDRNNKFEQSLEYQEAKFSFQSYVPSTGTVTKYTRFGDLLYFDRLPNTTNKLEIRYYKEPTAPDYDAGSPEIGRVWDEAILNLSLAQAHTALWRYDIGQSHEARYEKLANALPQPRLLDVFQHQIPERPTRTRPHGGAQG